MVMTSSLKWQITVEPCTVPDMAPPLLAKEEGPQT
jgi:hypothetical protein